MKRRISLAVIVLAVFASAALGQGGPGLRSSVTLTCNLDLCNTTNTAWTLDKCEDPTGVCNGFSNSSITAPSPFSWTITAAPGSTSNAVLTVNGFVRISNSGGAPATIGNIVVNLQKPGGGGKNNPNWVSHAAAVANASGGGTANICSQASSEGSGTFTNSAASLTFTDASNNSVWSITPQQTIPAGGTVDLLYQAVFGSFPTGQVRVEVIVTFGNSGPRGGGSSCANVDINGNGSLDGDESLVRSVPCRVTQTVPAEINANSTVILADREPQESAATPINGYTCAQYSTTTSPYVCSDPLFPFSGVGTGGSVTYSNHSTTVGTTNGDGEQISGTTIRKVGVSVDSGPGNINNCVRLTGQDVTVPVDSYTFTCVQGVRIRQCAWPDVEVAENHCTYTQGGWGAPPEGNNPGSILANNWTGNIVVGVGNTMTFSSPEAVQAYLPAGGKPGSLDQSHNNPASTSSGVFGGQVLALKLNLMFAANPIGNLIVCGTGGKTVAQVLADAEAALGGGTLPSYVTSIAQLSGIVDNLNNSYDNCVGAASIIGTLYCTQ